MDTAEYRSLTDRVQARSLRDLLAIWPLLNFDKLDESFPAWLPALSTLIDRDRRVMAGAASIYLADEFAAQIGAGSPVIAPAGAAPAAQVAASASAVTVAGYRTALTTVGPLEAPNAALVRTAGMVTRLVVDGGRQTITDSLKLDPNGTGWSRVTSPGACGFCRLIEGRGAVYSAETARFSAHDHCKCSARPVYGETALPVLAYEPSRHRDRSTPNRRERNNAGIRDAVAEL